MNFLIYTNKNISTTEYASLMVSVGWGSNYSEELILRSITAYPFIAHARSQSGELLGYVSAFSDRAFSTMLGELVVHPKAQSQGIGRALLTAVEQEFFGIPIYVKPLSTAKQFFLACGYRLPSVEIQVLFNPNNSRTK